MAEPTIIAQDTFVSGRVHGDDDLVVQGRVDGTVDLAETLTIDADGRIDGEVEARQVVIQGRFQGTISAAEKVVLDSTARVVADIRAPVVEMADGAQLRGELTVGVDTQPASSGSSRRRRSATAPASSRTASRSRHSASARPSSRTATPTARASQPASSATATAVVEKSAESGETPETEETSEAEGDGKGDTQPSADEPEISEESFEQYRRDFTVKELREKLRSRDLRVSGTKDELIERLLLAQR